MIWNNPESDVGSLGNERTQAWMVCLGCLKHTCTHHRKENGVVAGVKALSKLDFNPKDLV